MHELRRSAALTSLLSACALAALPASLAFRSADDAARDADLALVDPGIAKLGITEARQLSSVDVLANAPFRWNFPRFDAARLAVGESLLFILPGGRELEIPLAERLIQSEDSVAFLFADHMLGTSAEITISRGVVSGRVRHSPKTGPEDWRLNTGEDEFGIGGEYWTRATAEPSVFAPLAPTNVTQTGEQGGEQGGEQDGDEEGGLAGDGCQDTGALIDLLVAYTPDCLASFSGDLEALKAQVATDIAVANQGLSSSQSIPRVRIVGYWAAPDNTTGDITDDLLELQDPSDGWNDGVHAKRDQFAADLVMLYEAPSPQGGIAFGGIAGGEANGFSVNAAPDTFVAAKLIGFNMGACAELTAVPACNGYYDFSHAWLFTNDGSVQGTIMAAGVPFLYPIYSNIYVEVGGVATGDDEANNARTMSLTANSVAKFRCSTTIDQDCNNNGIIDAEEIAAGSAADCNGTGFPDECDIAFGISEDTDGDGVPDECPLTDIEFNLQGAVQLDTLGTSVSLSTRPLDPTVLMGAGAPGDDTLAPNSGEAFILEATAGAIDPLSIAILRPHDPATNAFFGRSISVLRRPARTNASNPIFNFPARKLALVSAFRWPQQSTQGNYPSKGACYLFEQRADGTWGQIQSPLSTGGTAPWQVTPAAGAGPYAANAYALVGYATAIGHAPNEVAELIAAGAPGQNEGRGAVYLWSNDSVTAGVRRPDRRTQLTPITHPTPQPNDLFGAAVAMEDQIQTSGTTPRVAVIIGAPGRDEGKGYAVIRERATSTNSFATSWPATSAYQFDLSSPVGPGAPLQAGYRFGEAVAIEGRLAVVGAPGASQGKGRIYVYERNTSLSGSWAFRGWYASDDPLVRGFGNAVSIARTADSNVYQIIVGASKADIAAGSALRVDAGAVFIYQKSLGTSAPQYLGMRISNTPSTGDEFGYSTSAVQGFGLIGAPFKDSGGLNSGAAKFITLP
jgi:hypothetical protein